MMCAKPWPISFCSPPPPQASWAESLGRVSGSGLVAGAGFGISGNFVGFGISGNFEYMLATLNLEGKCLVNRLVLSGTAGFVCSRDRSLCCAGFGHQCGGASPGSSGLTYSQDIPALVKGGKHLFLPLVDAFHRIPRFGATRWDDSFPVSLKASSMSWQQRGRRFWGLR